MNGELTTQLEGVAGITTSRRRCFEESRFGRQPRAIGDRTEGGKNLPSRIACDLHYLRRVALRLLFQQTPSATTMEDTACVRLRSHIEQSLSSPQEPCI